MRCRQTTRGRAIHDRSQPARAQFLGPGGLGIVTFKKASDERITELLGVLSYLAAPISTEEQLLLQYGVQGVDFTFDANGNPGPDRARGPGAGGAFSTA